MLKLAAEHFLYQYRGAYRKIENFCKLYFFTISSILLYILFCKCQLIFNIK